MEQPLNEAYQNEILEAYQKISDTFDDFTQLMRKRIPYEEWPDHCKVVAGCEVSTPDIRVKIDTLPDPIYATESSVLNILKSKELDSTKTLPEQMISRIQDIGRAQEKLQSILDDDMFDNLSKHDPYWHPTADEEVDRFYDIRMKMSFLHENLWKVMGILNKDETC